MFRNSVNLFRSFNSRSRLFLILDNFCGSFSQKTERFINKKVSNVYKIYKLNKLTKRSKLNKISSIIKINNLT